MKYFSLISFLLLSFQYSYCQWLPSTGIDRGVIAQVETFDSLIISCGYEVVWERNAEYGDWDNILDSSLPQICSSSEYVYIYTNQHNKILKSSNGQNWDTVISPNPFRKLVSLDTIIFGIKGYVHKSIDNGNSWSVSLQNFYASNIFSNDVALTIYGSDDYTRKIYKSEDEGITWDSIPIAGLPSLNFITCVMRFQSEYWSALEGKVYKYHSAGGIWTLQSDSNNISTFYEIEGRLFGVGSGIYRLTTDKTTWEKVGDSLSYISNLAYRDGYYFCGASYGVYRADSSFSWIPWNSGLHGGYPDLSFSDDTVWAINFSKSYISYDNAQTFSQITNPEIPDFYKVIITDSVYCGIGAGFYVSHDHGNIWQKETSGLPDSIAFHDLGIGYYLSTDKKFYKTNGNPFYWTDAGLPKSLYQIANANETVILATENPDNGGFPVYISHDKLESFDSILFFGSAHSPQIRYSNGYFILWERSDVKFYISADEGYTWDTIICPSGIVDAVVSGNNIFLITHIEHHPDKIYASYDHGSSWNEITDDLGQQCISYYRIYINKKRIFVATAEAGLYYRDDLITGITDNSKTEKCLMVKPVPANNFIMVTRGSEGIRGDIKILDMTGKAVISREFSSGKNIKVDIGKLNPGVYLVLYSDNSGILTKKIIKN